MQLSGFSLSMSMDTASIFMSSLPTLSMHTAHEGSTLLRVHVMNTHAQRGKQTTN